RPRAFLVAARESFRTEPPVCALGEHDFCQWSAGRPRPTAAILDPSTSLRAGSRDDRRSTKTQESLFQEESQLLRRRQSLGIPILTLGCLHDDDLRLNLRRQTVIAHQNIVQPIGMVLASPASRVHFAQLRDRVPQAL